MNYNEFRNYVIQEHWDNVVEITEGKLADYMMKGLIKFSRSDNPIAKSMRNRGMKQAKKYEKRRDAKLKDGLELIAEEIAAIISRHAGENIIEGEVTPNKSGSKVTIRCSFNSYDISGLQQQIEDYIQRCIERRKVLSYECEITKTSANVVIKLFK